MIGNIDDIEAESKVSTYKPGPWGPRERERISVPMNGSRNSRQEKNPSASGNRPFSVDFAVFMGENVKNSRNCAIKLWKDGIIGKTRLRYSR